MKQRGNALFLILIAVALFAALSYAVTQSGRGGGSIDREQASIFASQITQLAGQYENVITRMRLVNGCADTEISFNYDSNGDSSYTAADLYHNPNNPSNTSCFVFHPDGGGLTYSDPDDQWVASVSGSPPYYQNLLFSANSCIPGVGSSPVGGCNSNGLNDESLIFYVPYINENICFELARSLDTLTPSGAIPIDNASAWNTSARFAGAFTDGRLILNNGASDNSQSMVGQASGCFEGGGGSDTPADTFHFYHIILFR